MRRVTELRPARGSSGGPGALQPQTRRDGRAGSGVTSQSGTDAGPKGGA